MSVGVAILFGAILTVTGPTVIIPLLRQARLKERPASFLKWEGIVNDPIGALAAAVTLEILILAQYPSENVGGFFGTMVLGVVIALVAGARLGLLRALGVPARRGARDPQDADAAQLRADHAHACPTSSFTRRG